MSWYLFVDGRLLGVVDSDQREELRLDGLRGVEFVPVMADVAPGVPDFRAKAPSVMEEAR